VDRPIRDVSTPSMSASGRAAVLVKPKTIELREFARATIGPDDALLRIEACGICGSDYEQYERVAPPFLPARVGDFGAAGHRPRNVGRRFSRHAAWPSVLSSVCSSAAKR